MKLIKGRWNPIKLEFPFYYYPPFSFTIKGDGYNEIVINKFFNEIVTVNPLSYRNTYLDNEHQGYLEVKKFLKNDETYYLTKIYDLQDHTNFNYYFIKPKTKGSKLVDKEYPICALLKVNIEDVETYKDFYFNDFEFLEWVFITPSS
jgi:hypothetical protein